jgi:hypothetical protein
LRDRRINQGGIPLRKALLVVVLAFLIGTACGGGSGGDNTTDPLSGEEDYQTCQAAVGDLLGSLDAMQGLVEGNKNALPKYSSRVQELSDLLDKADLDALAEFVPRCGDAVGPSLDKAVTLYVRARSDWRSCVKKDKCKPEAAPKQLQELWDTAASQTEKAKEGLQGLLG